MNTERMTVPKIVAKKAAGEKITCLTAYDYPTALLVDEAGVDMILVGDSLAETVLGYETTLPVTMDEMRHHARAVVRAAKRALVIGDMPFLSYQPSIEEGIRNAGLFLKDGCTAVKVESVPSSFPLIGRLVESGIPVMGHLGLSPQFVNLQGGYRLQAKSAESAEKLLRDALTLQEMGVFAIVLELVPRQVAKLVSEKLTVPTIGIGAGPDCDGQVLVLADVLGLKESTPRHAKRYADFANLIRKAASDYNTEVKQGAFPTNDNCREMAADEYETLLAMTEGLETP